MKYIVIAIPGGADQPCEELGNKTPMEVAKLPNLNHFAKTGRVGLVKLTPDRMEPSSDATLLNLLGYDADKVYTGRGPLEAANLELKLEANEIAFRMNFITEADSNLADPTAGGIATKEAKALINFLNKKVANDFVRFFPGAEYRHVVVIKDSHGYDALSARTADPSIAMGEPIESNLPKGPGEELLKKLMFDARLLLQDHEINQVRVDLNENPANMIWLWGQGTQPKMEKFTDLYGVSGALVSDSEFAKGAARLAGLTVLDLPGSKDANEQIEFAALLLSDALEDKEMVFAYLTGCDEASWEGDLRAKISALESIDLYLLSKVKELLDKNKETRVLITFCHSALWKSAKHLKEAVPFVISGKNLMADDIEKCTEMTAKASGFKVSNGRELMNTFLSK